MDSKATFRNVTNLFRAMPAAAMLFETVAQRASDDLWGWHNETEADALRSLRIVKDSEDGPKLTRKGEILLEDLQYSFGDDWSDKFC